MQKPTWLQKISVCGLKAKNFYLLPYNAEKNANWYKDHGVKYSNAYQNYKYTL
jgi:hypothetical protein